MAGLASLAESAGPDVGGELAVSEPGAELLGSEVLVREAEEVPMVMVEVQLLKMVESPLLGPPVPSLAEVVAAPASEVPVGGKTPGTFERVDEGAKAVVVIDVRVSGQIVVDTDTMEV